MAAVRRLIVHIGTPKAASTSLQAWLAGERMRLAAVGIDYPALAQADSGHRRLALGLEGALGPAVRQREIERLGHVLAGTPADVVILSAEQFEGAPEPADVPGLIAAIAARHGFRPLALAVVRPRPGYLNAVYAQHVRRLFTAERFGPFSVRMEGHPRFDYPRRFKPWSDRKDMDFAAIPLTASELSGGIGPRLLAAAGLAAPPDAGPAPRLNVTPGPATIEAFRRLAAQSGRRRLGRRDGPARAALETAAEATGWNRSRFSGLAPDLAARIEARYADADEAFARRFWGRSFAEVFAGERAASAGSNEWNGSGPESAAIDDLVADILARYGRPEWVSERLTRRWRIPG